MSDFSTVIQQFTTRSMQMLEFIPEVAATAVAHDVRIPKKEGGNMPVRRGNLRNSLEASLNGMPASDMEIGPGQLLADPMPQIVSTVVRAKPGDVISLGFRADYARPMELKHAFVRLTAQKWPQIVDSVVNTIKRRIG